MIGICSLTPPEHPTVSLRHMNMHEKKSSLYTVPGAVEVVLTLAAASGDGGGIEPEGGPAVPVPASLVSIIAVEQSTRHTININMWKGTYCYTERLARGPSGTGTRRYWLRPHSLAKCHVWTHATEVSLLASLSFTSDKARPTSARSNNSPDFYSSINRQTRINRTSEPVRFCDYDGTDESLTSCQEGGYQRSIS